MAERAGNGNQQPGDAEGEAALGFMDLARTERVAGWLWLAVDRHGTTHDGGVLDGVAAALRYAVSQAKRGHTPSNPADAVRALGLLGGCVFLSSDTAESGRLRKEAPGSVFEVVRPAINQLMNAGLFGWLEPYLERILELARASSSPALMVEGVMVASSVLREQRNVAEALAVLESVADTVQSADAATRAQFRLNRGNILKDLSRTQDAHTEYEEAWALALASDVGSALRAAIAFQMGRYWQELHRLDEAQKWFEEAVRLDDGGTLADEYRWALEISRLQVRMEAGDLTVILRLSSAFAKLPPACRPDLETSLHNLMDRVARQFGLGLEREWAARMAMAAAVLSGRRRERAAVLADLALSLLSQRRGSEAHGWFSRAAATVEQTATSLHAASVGMSLAYCAYLFFLDMDRSVQTYWVNRYREAMSLEARNDPRERLRTLAQFALIARDAVPEAARDAAQEARQIADRIVEPVAPGDNGILDMLMQLVGGGSADARRPVQTIPGFGFLAAFELQAESPDTLSGWYASLRYSTQRVHGSLQTLLDMGGEAGVPAGAPLPFLHKTKRGRLAAELCAYGYLRLMLNYMAFPPRRALQWALDTNAQSAAARRLVVEWMLEPTGQPRVKSERVTELARDTLRLRGAQERLQFESELTPAATNGLPHQPSPKRTDEALRELRIMYHTWRARDVCQGLDGEIELHATLRMDPDDFLAKHFVEPRRRARDGAEQLPWVAMLLLGQDRSSWVLLDLESPTSAEDVRVVRISVNFEGAQRIASRLGALLARQERGDPSTAEDIKFVFESGMQLLRGIEQHVPAGRSIRLYAEGLWGGVPLEQLPLNSRGDSLVDRYRVMRFDVGRLWSTLGVRPRLRPGDFDAAVLADPTAGDFGLEATRQEGSAIARMLQTEAVIGEVVSAERFMSEVQQKQVVHVACHGYRIATEHRDYYALAMSDRYLLEAELAALALGSCRLVTIAACRSAQGDSYGVAPVASLAAAMSEAGADSVVGALTLVGDRRAQDDLVQFYRALLDGESPSGAMRRAFGNDARMRRGVLAFPWVAWGHDGVMFEVKNE